jgi:hypothetical protein
VSVSAKAKLSALHTSLKALDHSIRVELLVVVDYPINELVDFHEPIAATFFDTDAAALESKGALETLEAL